ncbi:molybdate ABC transporter substrate-binding protein [Ancylothrix sp. C2]|uniref:molybdate ABC transporter substrate-binding protein n=1 Tax=Ancylothrix sp. D3o TaxID=2953691 RepID=UPI0021BA92F1|nr:molybdate ABC transporter substrate-binding protein [Ancylothrix sp. D3o]MCT7951699.1 molybdate ABC transporter substrate-binding protein [Ancylothrix sp. D3o]
MTQKNLLIIICLVAGFFLSLVVGKTWFLSPAPQRTNLTVSAAISLTNVLQEIQPLYQQSKPQVGVTYNFGASGALQQQIEQGAPVDVFISAATKQMDALEKKGLLVEDTRLNLLRNKLVLITPKNGAAISNFKDLSLSDIKRIAIGEPKSVPAGQYAQEVLTNLGTFNQLKSKLILANNVRQVLTFVETGNVDAGIVYLTDAKESNKVQIRATAPENLHSPIVYPVAVLKNSKNVQASRDFVDFMKGNKAKAVYERYGFGV